MAAPTRPFALINQLLAEHGRRLDIQKLELDAKEAAIKARLNELAQQRAAIEAQIAKERD
jgi:cell division protein FtsB